MFRLPSSTFLICLKTGFDPAIGQPPAQQPPAQAPAGRGARPVAPTRDPNTPGYVKAKELPDGAIPSAKEDGNFILETHGAFAVDFDLKLRNAPGAVHEGASDASDGRDHAQHFLDLLFESGGVISEYFDDNLSVNL